MPAVFAGRWGEQTPLDAAVFKGKIEVFAGGLPAGFRFGGGRGGAERSRVATSCPTVSAPRLSSPRTRPSGRRRRRLRAAEEGPGLTRDTGSVDAGTVAILFVNLDDAPDAAAGAFARRNTMRPDPAAPGIPAGASITRATAERIFGRPVDQLTVGTRGQAVSGQWDYAWRMSEWPARNVIAILPGSDPSRAGEYVLISAHHDHVGVNGRAVDHDSLRAVNKVTPRQGANDPVCRPNVQQQHAIDSLIA